MASEDSGDRSNSPDRHDHDLLQVIQTQENRIERLERWVRGLSIAMIAMGFVGLTMLSMRTLRSATVEAETFLLRKPFGATSAMWRIDDKGNPDLRFFDGNGRGRLRIGITPSNAATLTVWDDDGKTRRLGLGMDKDGDAFFILQGKNPWDFVRLLQKDDGL